MPSTDLPLRPLPMTNPVRGYDWGSHTALASLQGRPPTPEPQAELWMGGHPSSPSTVDVDGRAVPLPADLPYLLKVLAVERALSVQVHPDHARAAQRFAAASGSYVDACGKPELLVTLTPFEAMAGFRDDHSAARLGRWFDVPGLELGDGPRAGLARIVHLTADERTDLSKRCVERAFELSTDPGADDVDRHLAALVVRLAEEHPGDALVVAPLLMFVHFLPAGASLYLPAGVPHAYLGGVGVEVMAASDNVLRAGLTTKHVDPEELLACLDPQGRAHPGLEPSTEGDAQVWWVPDRDFALARVLLDAGDVRLPDGLAGPHVVLATSGDVTVSAPGGEAVARQGFSVFVPAGSGPVTLAADGPATAYVAAPGRSPGR